MKKHYGDCDIENNKYSDLERKIDVLIELYPSISKELNQLNRQTSENSEKLYQNSNSLDNIINKMDIFDNKMDKLTKFTKDAIENRFFSFIKILFFFAIILILYFLIINSYNLTYILPFIIFITIVLYYKSEKFFYKKHN